MAKAQNIDQQSMSDNNKWALTYSIARKNQIPPFADEVFSSTSDLDNYLNSSLVVYDGQLFRVVDSNTNHVSLYYAKWEPTANSGNGGYVKEKFIPTFASVYDLNNYLGFATEVYDGQLFRVADSSTRAVTFYYAEWDATANSGNGGYVAKELVPANQGGGSNYVFNYTTEAQSDVIKDIELRAIPPKMYYHADLAISQSSGDDIGIESTLGIRDTNQGSHGGIIKSNGYYYIDASGVDPLLLGNDPRLHLQVADLVDNTVIEIAHFGQVNNGVKLYIGNATNGFNDIYGADNSKTDAYLHVGYQGNLPRISQVGDRYVIIFTHGFYLAASSARTAATSTESDLNDAAVNNLPVGPNGYNLLRIDSNDEKEIL